MTKHSFEQYWPKREPKWPVDFTVGVTSKHQAETLACCLIRVERYLRRRIPLGDYKNPNRSLADRLAVARRKLQEAAALVASDAEVAEIVRRNQQRIADLASGKVKGQSEAEFMKSLDEAAANLKKGIASPPISLKKFIRPKKGRKKP